MDEFQGNLKGIHKWFYRFSKEISGITLKELLKKSQMEPLADILNNLKKDILKESLKEYLKDIAGEFAKEIHGEISEEIREWFSK